jgi:hypothetical protein
LPTSRNMTRTAGPSGAAATPSRRSRGTDLVGGRHRGHKHPTRRRAALPRPLRYPTRPAQRAGQRHPAGTVVAFADLPTDVVGTAGWVYGPHKLGWSRISEWRPEPLGVRLQCRPHHTGEQHAMTAFPGRIIGYTGILNNSPRGAIRGHSREVRRCRCPDPNRV